MRIRRAEAAEHAALAAIRRSAILALAVPKLSPEQAVQWADAMAADRIVRAIRDHEVWVAVAADIVGWVEIAHDRIAALYVAPPYARRGVGAALMAHAEAAIRRAGCTTARLEASPNVLGFYLRRGYLHHGAPDHSGAYPMRKALSAEP